MARAFNSLVKSDIYDTILGAYLFAGKQGFKFNLTYTPNTFSPVTRELVDPKYMGARSTFRHGCIGELERGPRSSPY